MTQPLVSIVCPSRNRPEQVCDMIDSFSTHVDDPSRIEFVIRLHDDYEPLIVAIPNILSMAPNVRVVIGPTMRGYIDLNKFFDEGAAVSTGIWFMHMNDDMLCESKGWDALLAKETPDHIVFPEIHRLNESRYHHDLNAPFHIIPNKCWLQYTDSIPHPPDTGVTNLLRFNGWDTTFLEGITFWHNRDVSAEVEEQRKKDEMR